MTGKLVHETFSALNCDKFLLFVLAGEPLEPVDPRQVPCLAASLDDRGGSAGDLAGRRLSVERSVRAPGHAYQGFNSPLTTGEGGDDAAEDVLVDGATFPYEEMRLNF